MKNVEIIITFFALSFVSNLKGQHYFCLNYAGNDTAVLNEIYNIKERFYEKKTSDSTFKKQHLNLSINYKFGGKKYSSFTLGNEAVYKSDSSTIIHSYYKSSLNKDASDFLSDLDGLKKWKVIYYLQNGWREELGQNSTSYQYCYKTCENNVYSLRGLINIFQSEGSPVFNADNFLCANDRGSMTDSYHIMNLKWTYKILDFETLIFRFFWSYPNGNMTSWYQEETYIFKASFY